MECEQSFTVNKGFKASFRSVTSIKQPEEVLINFHFWLIFIQGKLKQPDWESCIVVEEEKNWIETPLDNFKTSEFNIITIIDIKILISHREVLTSFFLLTLILKELNNVWLKYTADLSII